MSDNTFTKLLKSFSKEQLELINTIGDFALFHLNNDYQLVSLKITPKAKSSLPDLQTRFDELKSKGISLKDPKIYSTSDEEKELFEIYRKIYRILYINSKKSS